MGFAQLCPRAGSSPGISPRITVQYSYSYEAERLIRAVGTFYSYRTYKVANKYVLWLILLTLSSQHYPYCSQRQEDLALDFPLFRNEKHSVFQKYVKYVTINIPFQKQGVRAQRITFFGRVYMARKVFGGAMLLVQYRYVATPITPPRPAPRPDDVA